MDRGSTALGHLALPITDPACSRRLYHEQLGQPILLETRQAPCSVSAAPRWRCTPVSKRRRATASTASGWDSTTWRFPSPTGTLKGGSPDRTQRPCPTPAASATTGPTPGTSPSTTPTASPGRRNAAPAG